MEVHSHTHTERKRFKHYLWEFLMLFLAVFCGFLAENQREHMIEKEREKQYMQSMMKDLKKDTASINRAVWGNKILLKGIDTVLMLIDECKVNKTKERELFIYSVVYTYGNLKVNFSEITLTQLKNSGGFRLIRKPNVSESILTYAQGIDACRFWYLQLNSYFHVYEDTQKNIFNLSLSKKVYDFIGQDEKNMLFPFDQLNKMVREGTYITIKGPELFTRYYNDILFYQTVLSNTITAIEKQKREAVDLIRLIETNYHI